MLTRFSAIGFALTLGAALVGAPPAADEKKADSKADVEAAAKAAKAASAVDALSAAFKMADMGRETKSPEMLIGAAKMVRKITVAKGDVAATDEKGAKVKSEESDLKEVAKDWLKEAGKMAEKDTVMTELIERLKKQEAQGSIGGPRQYFHRPGAGATITWNVTFVGGQPASVSVCQQSGDSLTLTVTGPGGHYYTWTGRNPSVTWVPRETKNFTITVRNNDRAAAAYTLYHN